MYNKLKTTQMLMGGQLSRSRSALESGRRPGWWGKIPPETRGRIWGRPRSLRSKSLNVGPAGERPVLSPAKRTTRNERKGIRLCEMAERGPLTVLGVSTSDLNRSGKKKGGKVGPRSTTTQLNARNLKGGKGQCPGYYRERKRGNRRTVPFCPSDSNRKRLP